MPLNALMIPTTVPNSPTKGAVEPIVARPLRPRFISACTIATERSRPRLAASITSVSETWAEADWNSDNPVATTLAMWLFLLRSSIEMASSSLPSRSDPASCCTKTRDCLRAALYINRRSIITPTDQADMINRMITTVRAGQPIWCHMVMMSQPTWACSQKLNSDKLASISFAPFRSLANCPSEQPDRPAPTDSLDECHATATPRPYEPKTKFTSIVVMTSTGSPLSRVGL